MSMTNKTEDLGSGFLFLISYFLYDEHFDVAISPSAGVWDLRCREKALLDGSSLLGDEGK